MPKFKVTIDGKSYAVTVPEGQGPQQAYAYARQHQGGGIGSLVRGGPAPSPTLASRALNAIGVNSPKAAGFGDSRALGFLDEAGAVFDTLGIGGSGESRPNIWKGDNPVDAWRYNAKRNAQQLAEKQQQDPSGYLGGQIVGAVLPGGVARVTGLGQRASQGARAVTAAVKSPVAQKVAKVALAAAPDVARGATYAVGSTQGGVGERLANAPEGAVLGLAGHAAGKAVGATASRLLGGKKASKAVQTLADEGVVMTPGRRGGPIRRTFEETVLGSVPFVKSIPQAANQRSIDQLNVAFYNRVLKPIGQKLPMSTTPGREAVDNLGNVVYGAYDAATSRLNLGMDRGLQSSIDHIKRTAGVSTGQNAKQLKAIIDQSVDPLTRGPVSGSAVRDLMGEIRKAASGFKGSASANERNMGDELWRVHDALDAALARQNGGQALKDFQAARQSVSLLKRVEDAASKSKTGVASPQQFRTAVTKRGYGTTTQKAATGKAPMQDLSDAASQVLPATIPNSGTIERGVGASLMAAGPASILHYLDPTMGGLAASSMAGYVPGLDRILQNFALKRPDLLVRAGKAVERASPALGTAGAQAALSQGF